MVQQTKKDPDDSCGELQYPAGPHINILPAHGYGWKTGFKQVSRVILRSPGKPLKISRQWNVN
jgi:hypothetical protein